MLFDRPNILSGYAMLTIEQIHLAVEILKVAAALAPAAIFAYKFWRGRAKIRELKEACEAAVNANKELLPLVTDERLKLAVEIKIAVLQVVVDLVEGDVITDNFGWELDEKVKTLAVWRAKR